MHSQLSNSYQWNMLNTGGKLIQKIQRLAKTGEAITFDRMPTALSVMRNRIKSPIFNKLLDAISGNQLMLVFNKERTEITPAFLPFVTLQTGGNSYVAMVFLDLCEARLGEGDEVLVNERKLKVAMESAYMALCMLDEQNSGKLQSTNIAKPSSKIYSYIMTECINRKHSIKMDQTVFDAMTYLFAKYFIRTVIGSTATEDVVDNYCLNACKNPNPKLVRGIADQFMPEDFGDISKLLTKMIDTPELKPRIGKMTVSNFTESYINMYDSAMILAMENYPYFVFNILSVIETTYINNYFHLKNIVGDEGNRLYMTLISSIC